MIVLNIIKVRVCYLKSKLFICVFHIQALMVVLNWKVLFYKQALRIIISNLQEFNITISTIFIKVVVVSIQILIYISKVVNTVMLF
jgi:hypothetical protein